MIRLVQLTDGVSRRVAMVDEPKLRVLEGTESVYALAQRCLREELSLEELARELANAETLDYDSVYGGASEWKLMVPVDVPGALSKMLVNGTGLTHLGSAKDRQAMHAKDAVKSAEPMTDSMKMFQWGVEGGRPAEGEIGIAPEWFHKGTGPSVRPPFSPLTLPAFGEDGGEEGEIAGIYIVAEDGTPYRIGMATGNEFSDHKFEKRNYLNLAGSKLRQCSLGPELVIGGEFKSVPGEVRIERGGKTVWRKEIETGEENMCHSLANMEHHHFKFEAHRQPGDVHVHYFGACALSFGEGFELQDGDWMVVQYEGYGRALRNPLRVEPKSEDRKIVVRTIESKK